jgi:hypothetical protein
MDAAMLPPSADRILELGYAFRASKALLSAVELGVFTALAAGPLDLVSLRRKIGIAERGARDFFDVLVALGMLARGTDGRYANTVETDLYLDAEKTTYIGGDLTHLNARLYAHWNDLTTSLRTGKPQSRGGAGNFTSMYGDPTLLRTFANAMTGGTRPVAMALAARFPWASYKSLIDVGTAEGCLPVYIAKAHPTIRGGGFDLAPLQPLFETYVAKHDVADRLRFFAGDFFVDAFPSADVLVLGRVLHNWDADTKMMLLRKAYASIRPGGAAVVYERLIDNARRINAAGMLSSLNMLLMTEGGFDFTAQDCVGWMRSVGFHSLRVENLTGDHAMVVGLK